MVTEAESPSFAARFAFAFVCFFKVLFDGAFAGRAIAVKERMPAPPQLPSARPSIEPPPKKKEKPSEAPKGATPAEVEAVRTAARREGFLVLLGALQQQGRLVDFLEDDVASASDADVGAAARVVHAGCKKALKDHVTIAPAHEGAEGAKVVVEAGYDAHAVKLTGKLAGSAPFEGKLVHKGWRATDVKLPTFVAGADPGVLAPAEVEL